jgi:hypothetical protein
MNLKRYLSKCFILFLIFGFHHNYLIPDTSQTQSWQTVTEDGKKYEIQCLVSSLIPDLSRRWLDMDLDDKVINEIQVKDSSGSIVEFVTAKNILILTQSGLKFSTTTDLDEGLYIYNGDIIKDNGNNFYGPSNTQPLWRDSFMYRGDLDGAGLIYHDHRANIYKEVFLNAILQPDTRKKMEIEFLKELEYYLYIRKTGTLITKMILEGRGIFRLEPKIVQTTLKNWEFYKIKASAIDYLGKLSVGLKTAKTVVDITGDAAQKIYLQVLADAYAKDRLDALKRFITENRSNLDKAMIKGFEDAEDFFNNKLIKGYYDNIGFALMETGSEHAVDLLSLGISITGLAVKVVGKLALPYLLAWEVYKLIKDPITEAQKMCLAITIQRTLFNSGMFEKLQKEITKEKVKDLNKIRDALNLFNINCYLSWNVYNTHISLYENNPFYTLSDILYGGSVTELTKRFKSMEDRLLNLFFITSPPYYLTWRTKNSFVYIENNIEYPWLLAKLLRPGLVTGGAAALSLIIDSSGSMSSNDPQNARIFAGELVLDQANNDWEIGIVDFDTSSQLLGSGAPQDKNLKESLKRIGASGGTNIQSGLKYSFDFLEKATGMKKGAILLTDGDHNTPSSDFDYNKFVDIYSQKGWPVYTLGLTGAANAVLLSKIAAMTGGMYFKANTYQDMLGIIDIILSQFKDETLICHYKNNIKQGEEKEFPFLLDDSVVLMDMTGTYPGSKVDFSLIDPQNQELNRTDTSRGVQVTEGKIYKIIKVKNPMPGQWKTKVKGLQVDQPTEPFEVKISADTPIKVETKEAKPVYMPFEPIEFKVNVAGNVNDQSLSYAVNVTPPEGQPEDIPLKKSSQVVYPKTQKPGVYYFKVKVTGEKTDKEQFMREGLKHIVVSDSGKEYGVGQITKLMGGYFEIDLGKEIGLKIGKKIFVFSISAGVKKKIAEGFVTSVSQGKSMVQLTESWALETPKVGNRVEIDRKEF